MQLTKNRPMRHRVGFALSGIRHALRTEKSLVTQVVVLVLVLVALVILRPSPMWCALIAAVSTAVIAAELFNTAVERLADRLHPEQHPEIQIVKDCAAGAVLVSSIGAIVVALLFVLDMWRHP